MKDFNKESDSKRRIYAIKRKKSEKGKCFESIRLSKVKLKWNCIQTIGYRQDFILDQWFLKFLAKLQF